MATLAERHRAAQDRLALRLVEIVRRSWRARMAEGVPSPALSEQWIADMLATLQIYRQRSEGTASLYYTRERYEQIPEAASFAGSAGDPMPDEQVFTSLDVAGRITLLQALQGGKHTLAEAQEMAESSVAGAASRLALDGGRSYTFNAFNEDRMALAYYRVTKAGCCSFCAMLASRGAVFKSDSFDASDARFFGPGDAKVHDHCWCSIGGIWVPTRQLPEFNTQMSTLWSETGARYSGKAARNAFRNAYEAQYGRRD